MSYLHCCEESGVRRVAFGNIFTHNDRHRRWPTQPSDSAAHVNTGFLVLLLDHHIRCHKWRLNYVRSQLMSPKLINIVWSAEHLQSQTWWCSMNSLHTVYITGHLCEQARYVSGVCCRRSHYITFRTPERAKIAINNVFAFGGVVMSWDRYGPAVEYMAAMPAC